MWFVLVVDAETIPCRYFWLGAIDAQRVTDYIHCHCCAHILYVNDDEFRKGSRGGGGVEASRAFKRINEKREQPAATAAALSLLTRWKAYLYSTLYFTNNMHRLILDESERLLLTVFIVWLCSRVSACVCASGMMFYHIIFRCLCVHAHSLSLFIAWFAGSKIILWWSAEGYDKFHGCAETRMGKVNGKMYLLDV